MNIDWKRMWTDFLAFADAHHRLMLFIGAIVLGFILGRCSA